MSHRSAARIAAIALATFGLVAGSGVVSRAQTTKDLVYTAMSKDIREGTGTARLSKLYKCNVPPGPNGSPIEMEKVTLPLALPFVTHKPCDEDGNSGTIKTTWTILLRVGPATTAPIVPFGTHSGSGTYTDSAGNVARVSFSGTVGCGTHRDPFDNCETCRENLHFEGLLVGKYTSGPIFNTYSALGLPAPGFRASYTGWFANANNTWPTAANPSVPMAARMMIDGVYYFNCGG